MKKKNVIIFYNIINLEYVQVYCIVRTSISYECVCNDMILHKIK